MLKTLKVTLRAAVWKSTRQPEPAGLAALILCTLAALCAGLVLQYAMAGAHARFVPTGINASVASLAVAMAISAFFVRAENRSGFVAAIMLLSAIFSLLGVADFITLKYAASASQTLPRWALLALPMLWFAIWLGWWSGAVYTLLRSFEPGRRYTLLRTGALWVAMLLASFALPFDFAFSGPDTRYPIGNPWDYIQAYANKGIDDGTPKVPRVNRAEVELAQPALLDSALAGLAPQIKGKTDIYAVGLAGSSEQDVFGKEMNGGLDALARVFPLESRVVHLSNQVETAGSAPVASRQNFATAVHAIAKLMDREEDVLLLFMTSHGSPAGVSLSLAGAFYTDLSPADIAGVLDREGIVNRIVIVSACYSGVFLKPLSNEHTIIMTAADDVHPSFGCSNEREWTYFGDAFFHRSLHPGRTIEQAFLEAKTAIAQWETRDGLTHSNPQGYFGQALTAKLAPLYLEKASKSAMMSDTDR